MCIGMINAHYYFKTHSIASEELTGLARKGAEGALNYTWTKHKKKGSLNDYYLREYIKSIRAQSVDLTYNDSIK